MKENRQYPRTRHSQGINITFSSGPTMKAYTHDISNGGLLIECPNHPTLEVGEIAEVIVLGIEGAIPRSVKIVRIYYRGKIAVKFTGT